ncbi:Retrovirus-related Pol polyprotein from transposon RE1 [Vitis vinifera]|uniref:Retrovirus-related Pol polyprotein from transposon RE1 n=1 Tax=Vitis vinifera TaxID=29760 RepID=A0A438EQX9_VITVI|nr:Retrovirus-related Pol polyprotein from transposon RE1 [Vitis vinifera]
MEHLGNTYAKPTHGHIKQVKRQLKKITKGPASVTEFLQAIKAQAGELALLGALLDTEDLTKTILVELGDDYKELVRVVQARDTSITFDEFHEKLLNFQASVFLTKPDPSYFPATTHPTSRSTTNWRPFHNHAIDPPHPLVADQHLLLAIDLPVYI